MVSEGSTGSMRVLTGDFPADWPHQKHFHCLCSRRVALDTRCFQQIAEFVDAVTSEGRNLLTTSPQSRIPPSTAPSQGLGHRLRVLPTFVV